MVDLHYTTATCRRVDPSSMYKLYCHLSVHIISHVYSRNSYSNPRAIRAPVMTLACLGCRVRYVGIDIYGRGDTKGKSKKPKNPCLPTRHVPLARHTYFPGCFLNHSIYFSSLTLSLSLSPESVTFSTSPLCLLVGR